MIVVLGFALVAAAVVGTLTRWRVGQAFNRELPWGTFLVNVSGAFVAGLLTARDHQALAMILAGGVGSLTTLSSLANEITDLTRRRQLMQTTLYLSGTLAFGVLAAWLGLRLGR